jgi:threonine synthase
VENGALPFSCQGNENGLVIEGGKTIGYEIVEQMAHWPANPNARRPPIPDPDVLGASEAVSTGLASIDRLFLQVGGGALASACVQGLNDSFRAGRVAALPRVHAVQTCGAYPLKRAYDRLVEHLLGRVAKAPGVPHPTFPSDDERAQYLLHAAPPDVLDEAFHYARTHRSEFMWPWETEPRSIAGGILDDETYDWATVVEGMVRTGGFPIVVDEPTLAESNRLAREATGIDVDHTGSSGLAGLLALTRTDRRPRPDERVVVLFTGVRREVPISLDQVY